MNPILPPIKVFAGTKSRYMAEEICKELGIELGKMNIQHFADGEFEVSFEESIRGCEVYLVQSTFPNSDNLMELLLMLDAAKRASAKSVIAVIPYFGWARQDRKDKPRVSIAAKLVSDLLVTAGAAGADRVITMDLHADQIQGFFNIPLDHLYASSVFIPIMSDPASERVDNCGLTEMIFTNSIPFNKECRKATILSVAKLFADTIRRVHTNESISSQYLIK